MKDKSFTRLFVPAKSSAQSNDVLKKSAGMEIEMHKGDYHTDYSKYYDKEYKNKDLAFEHVKKLKQEVRQDHGVHESAKAADEGHVTIKRKKIVSRKQKKEGGNE